MPGSTCKVMLGGDLILTGYIDDYAPTYDAGTHTVTITGRSNTEDVVDSSYTGGISNNMLNGPWMIDGGSLKKLVTQILKQVPNVGLTMDDADDVTLKYPYPVSPGESIYSVIENLCRMASRLLWDDAKGNLVISQVGSTRAGSALVEGQNVEAAAVQIDWSQRFYQIFVINTAQAINSINIGVLGKSDPDTQIRQGRIKLIIADSNLGPDNELAKQRADWEMNRRKGRSEIVQVHVTGWRDGAGTLWTPNTIVNVSLPTLKVNADLVVAEAEWVRSDDFGTQTILTLMPKGALQPEPFLPPFGLNQAPD